MSAQARAVVESALRARKLDRTLTTALPPIERPAAVAPTGIAALDACLHGGLPRGELSELAGPRSSGRTAIALQMMAEATGRGELAALVDTLDRFDVASAAAAGVAFDRLLWVRGHGTDRVHAAAAREIVERAVDRALKALALILQAGGFGLVVLDAGDVPLPALSRLPFTTWLRVQRALEGRDTACVLIAPAAVARSAGGLTVSLSARAGWTGAAARSRRLQRLDIRARVISPRRRLDTEVAISARAADEQCPVAWYDAVGTWDAPVSRPPVAALEGACSV